MKHYLTLIATLTGLTILTACGGEAANSAAAGQLRQLVSPECQANPFEQSCIEEFAVLRSIIIGSCRDNPTAPGCATATDFVCMITEDNPHGNPFDPLCNTEDREVVAARAEVVSKCMDGESDATSTICAVAVVTVCDDNAFEEICDTERDYVEKRKDVIDECESGSCTSQQMTQVCTDNPYNTLCFEDNTFDQNRAFILATCGTDSESEFCPEAIKPLCADDPFDSRCDDGQDYIKARGDFARACAESGNCQPDVLDKICQYNPYDDVLCSAEATGDTYNIARVLVKNSCRTEDDRHPLCPELVAEDCMDNPFDTLCNADDAYTEARLMVIDDCRTDDTGRNCDDAIAHVCTDSGVLFTDVFCAGDTYNAKRNDIRASCDTDTPHVACPDVVVATCTDNPFDALCRTDESRETYESARNNTIAACRSVSRDGKNCTDALAEVCVGDVLFTDTLCNSDSYNKARVDECAGGSTNVQCSLTVELICNGDPFNVLCGGTAYAGARKTACIGFFEAGTIKVGCDDAVIEICTADPFDADVCYAYASNYNDDNGALDYTGARNAAVGVCEGDSSGALCADATLFICATNPYNTLCYDPEHAMAGDYVNARDMAITDCRTMADGVLCADAIVQACTTDIFDGLCSDARYTPDKITACIAGVIAGTADAQCDDIGGDVIAGCIADPFAAACTADDSDFDDYVDSAQGQRFAYCKNLADDITRQADTLCSGGYVACDVAMPAEFCGVNFDSARIATCGDTATIFDAVCDGGAYESDRIAFCRMNLFHDNCAGEYAQTAEIALHCGMEANLFISDCEGDNAQVAEIGVFCDTDPFNVKCVGDYENQTAKQRECEAGLDNAECINTPRLNLEPPVIRTIDVAGTDVPQANFAHGIVSVTLNDAGDAVVAPDESEAGDASTVGAVNIVSRRGGAGIKAAPNTNPDGFAIFTLVRNTELPAISTSWHAAILATTNLGAPLATAPSTAIWPGHFNLSDFNEGAINSVDFSVDFGDGKIGFANDEGGIATDTDRPQNVIMAGFSLDISFGGDNADGLLTGTATVNDMDIPVRGLIGTEGAVAVFVKSGLAGGFTASNPFHGSYTPPAVEPVEPPRAAYVDATPSVVNYADWEGIGDYAPADSPNIDNPANGFLQGLASTLDTTGTGQSAQNAQPPTIYILNFADATYGGAAIDGDERDGLAVFSGTIPDGDTFHYAGVFSGTDLGAPVTGTDGATVIWNGRFISRGSVEIDKDFELTIQFRTSGGSITAFVPVLSQSSGGNDPYFRINASFDASGIIAPSANNLVYDTFTNNDVATPVNGGDRIEGTLASIIGEDGALGVFHGAGAGGASWAGGFVAAPAAPTDACASDTSTDMCRVRHSDWTSSFTATLPATAAVDVDAVFQYLNGTTEDRGGLNITGIRTGSDNSDPVATATTISFAAGNSTFNGNSLAITPGLIAPSKLAKGGVAFVRGWTGDEGASTDKQYYFAALLSNTDLGAPVVGRTGASAIYNGRFVAIDSNASAVDKDFSLTVRFATGGGGRLDAFIPDNIPDSGVYFRIDGAFNPQGVITPTDGNIILAEFTDNDPTKPIDAGRINGTLTGLIGQNGVAGAFYGGVPSSAGIAGGFVALPEALAVAPPTANYGIWLEQGGGKNIPIAPSNGGRILQAFNEHQLFTRGVGLSQNSGLSLQWSTHRGTPLGGDWNDSVAFFSGTIFNSPIYYYAGVLSGTDLGAPLTDAAGTTANFYGRVGLLRGSSITASDIVLNVHFNAIGAGTIGGRFVGFDQNYTIRGRFDGLGIVTGDLIKPEYHQVQKRRAVGNSCVSGRCRYEYYYVSELKTNDAVVLSGLIGTEGVVAGFAGANYSGGFVAIPNRPDLPPPPIITYDTWIESPFARNGRICPFNDFNNQFLRISPQNGGEALSKCDVNVDPDTGNNTSRRHVSVDINRRLNPNTGLTGGITYLHGLRDWDADWQSGDYDTTGALRVRYAGIHPDTNVGELLPRAATYNNHAVGTWKGVFVAVRSGLAQSSAVFQGSETPGSEGVTFGLNVNYNERTLAIHPGSVGRITDYVINGTYDDNGIISGSVSNLVEDYPDAILTGVIGRKGAAAIFTSPDSEFGSVGGFVACPTDDPANGGNGDCTTLQ